MSVAVNINCRTWQPVEPRGGARDERGAAERLPALVARRLRRAAAHGQAHAAQGAHRHRHRDQGRNKTATVIVLFNYKINS